MSKPFTHAFLLLLLLSTTGCLRPFPTPAEGLPEVPPELVPARTIQQTENITLLWGKEIELQNYYQPFVDFFTPGEQSVIYWSPETKMIVSMDAVTGETLWESEAPDNTVMRLYQKKFFITSDEWLDTLETAPIRQNATLPDCSFAREIALLVYDAYTGERVWGYVYEGANSGDVYFQGENVFLTGHGDHGESRSIVKINAGSGELIGRQCNKWPDKSHVPSPPGNEGILFSPYRVVLDERDLGRQDSLLFFVAEGTRLTILDGETKDVLSYIDFDGANLNPWDIDVTVQNGVTITYLNDSNQLFGFRS